MNWLRCGTANGRCGRWLAVAVGLLLVGSSSAQVSLEEMAWAYAISPPNPPEPVEATRYSVPGAEGQFMRSEIRNFFGPADWFPGDHPVMPEVVRQGREAAGVWACSMCHYPNGKGRPENAGVAGLPVAYFIQQMHDFRAGLRRSTHPEKANTNLMVAFAQNMTEAEITAAAEYFGSMQWTPWIEVIETEQVPITTLHGGMHLRVEGAGAGEEALGRRIVESPIDAEQTEWLRNPRSGFVAWAPVGSIARGRELATTGANKTIACAICHGETLNGLGQVPTLRGRSPSYLARQLVDFQHGFRRGAWAPLMTAVVENLDADDMIALTAYLASLPPEPAAASQ